MTFTSLLTTAGWPEPQTARVPPTTPNGLPLTYLMLHYVNQSFLSSAYMLFHCLLFVGHKTNFKAQSPIMLGCHIWPSTLLYYFIFYKSDKSWKHFSILANWVVMVEFISYKVDKNNRLHVLVMLGWHVQHMTYHVRHVTATCNNGMACSQAVKTSGSIQQTIKIQIELNL